MTDESEEIFTDKLKKCSDSFVNGAISCDERTVIRELN